LLEFRPVQHSDIAALVFNNSGSLQMSRRLGDTFAAGARRIGNQFFIHGRLVRGQTIQMQQQPATKLLLDGMSPMTYCSLLDLPYQGSCIAQQQDVQRAATLDFPFQKPSIEAEGIARALHHRAARSGLSGHGQGSADHVHAPDDGNLR